MKKELTQLSAADLQSLFYTQTKRFIASIEEGTPVKLLQPMMEQIKEIGRLIENKKLVAELQ